MHHYTVTILPGVNPGNPVRPPGEIFQGLPHGMACAMACAAAIGAGWKGFSTPKTSRGPRTPAAWRLSPHTSVMEWTHNTSGATVRIERAGQAWSN